MNTKNLTEHIKQGELEIIIAQGSVRHEDHDATITIKVGNRTVILKAFLVMEQGSDGKLYAIPKVVERHIRSRHKQKLEQSGVRVHKSIQEIVGDPRIGVVADKDGVREIRLDGQGPANDSR